MRISLVAGLLLTLVCVLHFSVLLLLPNHNSPGAFHCDEHEPGGDADDDTRVPLVTVAKPLDSDLSGLIYIYDVPHELLSHGGRVNLTAVEDEDLYRGGSRYAYRNAYALEWLLPRLLRRTAIVTDDPMRARLFLVPHYATGIFHHYLASKAAEVGFQHCCIPHVAEYMSSILAYIRRRYPFFNRSCGQDHVWIFSHDRGAGVAHHVQSRALSRSSAYDPVSSLATFDLMGRGHWVLNAGSHLLRGGYRPSADVVSMPPASGPPVFPGARRRLTDRHVLSVFVGSTMSTPVRRALRRSWASEPRLRFLETRELGTTPYWCALTSSVTAVHAAGLAPAKWSGRFNHIFQARSIPLIVIDHIDLPFQQTVEWERFSLFIDEATASQMDGATWREFVAGLSSHTLASMQRALDLAAAQLWYNTVPQKGDATHVLAHELMLKARTRARDAVRTESERSSCEEQLRHDSTLRRSQPMDGVPFGGFND